jgi:aquaporin Z
MNKNIKTYLAEFIGTMGLIFVILSSGEPVIISLALYILIVLNKLSGAHYNPAVTLTMFINKKISGTDSIIYVAAQLAGGAVAYLLNK